MAFSPYLTAAVLTELNANMPFEKVDDFSNHSAFDSLNLKERKELKTDVKAGLAVQSRYFKILATAQIGNSYAQLNSLLYRNLKGNAKVSTVTRAQGILGFEYARKNSNKTE